MNDDMTLSPIGEKLIQSFEGLSLKAYKDYVKNGVVSYSIGYGHNGKVDGKVITPGLTITVAKAEELFRQDSKVYIDKVKHYIKVPLTQNQFDALVSLAYNVSTAHFEDFVAESGINEGHYENVPKALMKYNVSSGKVLKGLTRRRTQEGLLFSANNKLGLLTYQVTSQPQAINYYWQQLKKLFSK